MKLLIYSQCNPQNNKDITLCCTRLQKPSGLTGFAGDYKKLLLFRI